MKRPFYVHTPCNVHGESLVNRYNGVKYEIRSYYTRERVWAKIKDRGKAKAEAERLNDDHEVEMARAMHI